MSSSNAPNRVLRSEDIATDVYLIGAVHYNIGGTKLPSIGQVLRVFFLSYAVVAFRQP